MTFIDVLFDALKQARAREGTLTEARWKEVGNEFYATFHKKQNRAAAIESGAEEIYSLFPKKVGKDEALKAITKALKKNPKEYLLDKTNQFRLAVESWPSSYRYFTDGGDRCPHPTTWFNQGRFADDPKEWRRAGSRSAPNRPETQVARDLTPEEKVEQIAFREKYRAMPEPEKGSFEHSLWLEARKNDIIASVAERIGSVPKLIEHEQRLRKA